MHRHESTDQLLQHNAQREHWTRRCPLVGMKETLVTLHRLVTTLLVHPVFSDFPPLCFPQTIDLLLVRGWRSV